MGIMLDWLPGDVLPSEGPGPPSLQVHTVDDGGPGHISSP